MHINIEAPCAAHPEAAAHSPSQNSTELAQLRPPSQRELRKDGGGDGGELVWRGLARGGRAPSGPRSPKAKSCATSCSHVLRNALRSILRHVLRRVLHVLVLHVSPKGSVGGGMRMLGVGSAFGSNECGKS